jgi:hypothetical protein
MIHCKEEIKGVNVEKKRRMRMFTLFRHHGLCYERDLCILCSFQLNYHMLLTWTKNIHML